MFDNIKIVMLYSVMFAQACAPIPGASFARIDSDPTWKSANVCFSQGCNDDTTQLTNGSIEFLVKSHNSYYSRPGSGNFALSFFLKSNTSLVLNVSEIEMLGPNNVKRTPEGFVIRKRPFRGSTRTDYCMTDNYHSRGDISKFPGFNKATSTLYRVMADTCYDLIFPGPPPKLDEVFYLNLAGVRSIDQAFRLPLVKFARN